MTKDKSPPKKKTPFIRTTSKRTGAIILISFVVLCALIVGFFVYAFDFAEKQKQHEDNWRSMSCDDQKSDYVTNAELWKLQTMFDLKCISYKEYSFELNKWTKN